MNNDYSVGIDLVKISRFKKIPFDKHRSFYEKNFSQDEINYCLKFNEPYKHFAGKFAIKEATMKALNKKLALSDIKTFHKESKPQVIIKENDTSFKVSVSHDGNFAAAIVISRNLNN
tara:strand:- start:32 stop:382 length:351 start_codon:yes stop_codon:yes gene_type:complete